MYKVNKYQSGCLKVNESTIGETLERKIERYISNKEPIPEEVDNIYTKESLGVVAVYNPRTDPYEYAIETLDKAKDKTDFLRKAQFKVVKNDSVDGNNEQSQSADNQ